MRMHPLSGSSRIAAYGYEVEPGTTGRNRPGLLALEFHDGSVWHYPGVPERVLADFLLAKSRGAFLSRVIGPNYPGHRFDEGA